MSEYWGSVRRHPVLAVVWASMILIYLAFFPFHAWGTGDTETVINSVALALACMKEGRFIACDIHSHFPLFQFVLSTPLHMLGLATHPIKGVLILINLAAYVGMFAVGFWLFGSDRRTLALFSLILLCSPFWVFAIGSLGEPTAAFLILLFVALCIARKPWWLLLLVFVAAGLTKETAAPVLLLLGIAAGPINGWRWSRDFRNHVFVMVAGVLLTVLVSALWNVFRYGVPWNASYALQAAWSAGIIQNLRFFAALWLSPHSGLLFFWPAWTLTVLAIIAVSRSTRAWLVALALFVQTVGLSQWWAPFGWDCYGQRLMLPWLPACALVLIYYERQAVDSIILKISKNRWLAGSMILAFLASTMPHLLVAQGWYAFHDALAAHDFATYPMLREHVNPDVNAAIYYRDVNLLMWAPDTNVVVALKWGLSQLKYYPWLLISLFCLGDLWRRLFGLGGKTVVAG